MDGISPNVACGTNWVFTKPFIAAITAELKTVLPIPPCQKSVARDANMVLKVMAAIDTTTTMPALINIATALLQMTLIIVSGSDVEIVNFIGDHESCKCLFYCLMRIGP